MAKKDVTTNLEIEREEACEHRLPENESSSHEEQDGEKTVVKNAHATGLGSIGRNEQKVDRGRTDFNTY